MPNLTPTFIAILVILLGALGYFPKEPQGGTGKRTEAGRIVLFVGVFWLVAILTARGG